MRAHAWDSFPEFRTGSESHPTSLRQGSGNGNRNFLPHRNSMHCIVRSWMRFRINPNTPRVWPAQPAAASELGGWSGVEGSTSQCVGQAENCRFTLTENSSVAATFSVVMQQQLMPEVTYNQEIRIQNVKLLVTNN